MPRSGTFVYLNIAYRLITYISFCIQLDASPATTRHTQQEGTMSAPIKQQRSLLKRKPVIRVVMVLLALLTAWQIFAQFLWIAPASQLRTLIPGNFLTSWQIPFFGQSWSVFAPDPINGNYVFKVRAVVSDGSGDARTTEWVDATAAEHRLSEHSLFPSRAAGLADEQATDYKTAFDALTEAQREVVADNWWSGADWKARLEQALRTASGDDQQALADANAFITVNAFTDAYATQVAHAMWGEHVDAIQFEIYRQNVIPFADRNDPAAKPQPKQYTPTGWRGTFTMPGQSEKDFADTFKQLAGSK